MKTLNILSSAAAAFFLALPNLGFGQTIDVSFGNLYNSNHVLDPTFVTGGTGLGTSLVGETFLWVCMDITIPSPDNSSHTFNIGTDHTALSTGIWGQATLADIAAREAITGGVSNMFFTYQSELLGDISGDGFNNTPGTAFQMATWYLANGYENNVWNGVLDATAVADLIAWDGGGFLMTASGNSWVVDMLNASLNSAASVGQTTYFASAASDSNIQSVAMFMVPEPGSLLLVSLSGGWFFLRRRRVAA